MTSEPVKHPPQRASWSVTITTLDTRNECGQSEVDYCSDFLSQKLRNRRNDLSSLAVPNTGPHLYVRWSKISVVHLYLVALNTGARETANHLRDKVRAELT